MITVTVLPAGRIRNETKSLGHPISITLPESRETEALTETEGPTALKAILASSVGLSAWQGARESEPAASRPASACGSVLGHYLGVPGGGKDGYWQLVLTSEELMPFDPFRLFLKKDLFLIFLKLYVGVYICMSACAHKSRYPRMPGAGT